MTVITIMLTRERDLHAIRASEQTQPLMQHRNLHELHCGSRKAL